MSLKREKYIVSQENPEQEKQVSEFITNHTAISRGGFVIKQIDAIRIYEFKKHVFLILKKSYYRIPNEEFFDISRDDFLTMFKINKFTHVAKLTRKYKCPCCGYYTLDNQGLYDICPVCFWEDNNEFNDPNEYDDCNKMTLNQARRNYLEFGACKKDMIKYCRKPRKNEIN